MYYETFTSFIELFVWHSFWRIFTNGTITFRGKKFYFIDEQDGDQAKVLSNADEVNIIKFGARVL